MIKKNSTERIYGILIKDIIRKELVDGGGIKVTNDEGYNKFTFFKSKYGKYYIDNFTYDRINEDWYHRTYCQVIDGEEARREILKELYGED